MNVFSHVFYKGDEKLNDKTPDEVETAYVQSLMTEIDGLAANRPSGPFPVTLKIETGFPYFTFILRETRFPETVTFQIKTGALRTLEFVGPQFNWRGGHET